MIRGLIWSVIAILALAIVGCGSPDVEVPENPTPPPSSDPVSTSTPSQDVDG